MEYTTDTLKRQRRQVKTIILQRGNAEEDWGIEISGNGWQDGEWIRKIQLGIFFQNKFDILF